MNNIGLQKQKNKKTKKINDRTLSIYEIINVFGLLGKVNWFKAWLLGACFAKNIKLC